MPTGKVSRPYRSPANCCLPRRQSGALACLAAGGAAVISVSVSHNDTVCTVEVDGMYSPDLLDDACRRAAACLVATMVQLLAAVDED